MMKYILTLLTTLLLVVSCDTASDDQDVTGLKLELRNKNNQMLTISTLGSFKVQISRGTELVETSGCLIGGNTQQQQHIGFHLDESDNYTVEFFGYTTTGCSQETLDWHGQKDFAFNKNDDETYISLLVTKANSFVLSSFTLNTPRAFFTLTKENSDRALLLLGGIGSSYSRINPINDIVPEDTECPSGRTCVYRGDILYSLKTKLECTNLGAPSTVCDACLAADASDASCLFNCPSNLNSTCTLRGSNTGDRILLDGGTESLSTKLAFSGALSTSGSFAGINYIAGGSTQLELTQHAPYLYHINQNVEKPYDMIYGDLYQTPSNVFTVPAKHIFTDFQSTVIDDTLYFIGGTVSGYNNSNTYSQNNQIHSCVQNSSNINCTSTNTTFNNVGGKLFCTPSEECYLYGGFDSGAALTLDKTVVKRIPGDLFRPEILTIGENTYAMGGIIIEDGSITSNLNNQIYILEEDQFVPLTLNEGSPIPGIYHATYTPYKEGFLISGGLMENAALSNVVYYVTPDAENKTYNATPIGMGLNYARIGHGVYVDGDNIWVIGGMVLKETQLNLTRSIEIFTPSAQ